MATDDTSQRISDAAEEQIVELQAEVAKFTKALAAFQIAVNAATKLPQNELTIGFKNAKDLEAAFNGVVYLMAVRDAAKL